MSNDTLILIYLGMSISISMAFVFAIRAMFIKSKFCQHECDGCTNSSSLYCFGATVCAVFMTPTIFFIVGAVNHVIK